MTSFKAEHKKEPWSLKRVAESYSLPAARLLGLDARTLTLMQVSALRGIVEIEFAIDECRERLSDLRAKRGLIEKTENDISKALADKKHESDVAHYLRTGRFPE